MRYRLVFDRKYKVTGRSVVNMRGSIVIFQDGVATVTNKDTADYARKLRFIDRVEEIPEDVPVVVETVLPVEEEVVEEEVVKEEEVIEEEEPIEEEEEETVEEEASSPSAEEITALYEELGTWTAVAKHYGVTTTILRKYREEAGLL